MNDFETRFYDTNLEKREDGKQGTVYGRPIVFNSVADIGLFDEVIMPGALDETDLTDVRLCLNHDTSYVYARSRRNNPNSTMRLMPDASGMTIEADLDIEGSPAARDLYSAITRNDLDKMSFMFSVADDEWENLDSDHPLRRIKKIRSVVEVSAVTFPAYNSTDIYTRSKEALENARLALESAKQQRAKEVETSNNKDTELLLLKEQTKTLSL